MSWRDHNICPLLYRCAANGLSHEQQLEIKMTSGSSWSCQASCLHPPLREDKKMSVTNHHSFNIRTIIFLVLSTTGKTRWFINVTAVCYITLPAVWILLIRANRAIRNTEKYLKLNLTYVFLQLYALLVQSRFRN